MNRREIDTSPRTVVEFLDHVEHGADSPPCPHVSKMVRVNGQLVRVAQDGVEIDPGGSDKPTIVTLRLLVDEVMFW